MWNKVSCIRKQLLSHIRDEPKTTSLPNLKLKIYCSHQDTAKKIDKSGPKLKAAPKGGKIIITKKEKKQKKKKKTAPQ